MEETQRFVEDSVVARRYEYADGSVLAVDTGAGSDGAVDVVDGTLVVVDGDEQFELELPDGTTGAQATINNGVVTVELTGDDPEAGSGTEADR